MLGEWTYPDDYHGDSSATATAIVTDIFIEGALNHPFDIDYFAIPLIADQTVLLTLDHEIQDEYVGEDLYVTLQTPNGVNPEGLDSMQGTATSMHAEWVVPVVRRLLLRTRKHHRCHWQVRHGHNVDH